MKAILDYEFPKRCYDCKFFRGYSCDDDITCELTGSTDYDCGALVQRMKDCPLRRSPIEDMIMKIKRSL